MNRKEGSGDEVASFTHDGFCWLHPPPLRVPSTRYFTKRFFVLSFFASRCFWIGKMPLRDRDPNVSNRDSLSRASNVSGKTGLRDGPAGLRNPPPDFLPNTAGVLSMLKTTTETGDLGVLASRRKGLPKIKHGMPHPPTNALAPSRTSSHYSRAGSVRSKASSSHSQRDQNTPRPWPHDQWHQADSLRYPAKRDARTVHSSNSMTSTTDRFDLEPRSYSLTASAPPRRRPSNPMPLRHGQSNVPFQPRPRSPFLYPTRSRRPGYRPSSPAMSDTYVGAYNRTVTLGRTNPGLRSFTASPLQHNFSVEGSDYEVPMQRQIQYSERNYLDNEYRRTRHPTANAMNSFELAESEAIASQHVVRETASANELRGLSNHSNLPLVGHDGASAGSSSFQPRLPIPTDSTPYVGFVQRVKKVLEERASLDDYRRRNLREVKARTPPQQLAESRPAEPEASPIVKRLTREMIKAAMGPPSDTGAMSPEAPASVISLNQIEDASIAASSAVPRDSLDIACSVSSSEVLDIDTGSKDPAPASSNSHVHSDNVISPVKPLLANANVFLNTTENQESSAECYHSKLQDIDSNDSNPRLHPTSMTTSPAKHSSWRPASLPSPDSRVTPVMSNARMSMPLSTEVEQRSAPSAISVDNYPTISSLNTTKLPWNDSVSVPPSAQSSLRSVSMAPSSIGTGTGASSSLPKRKSFNPDISEDSTDSDMMNLPQTLHTDGGKSEKIPSTSSSVLYGRDAYTLADSSLGLNGVTLASNDSKLSAVKQFHSPMPDLTEDSQEDASTTNLRILGSKPTAFRSGAQRKRRELRGLPRPEIPGPPPIPTSYLSRKLSDMRNIPSLNFSHTDLTTKLNLALGLRSSTPFEKKNNQDSSSGNEVLAVDRPESTLVIRGRYRSFFSEADELEDATEISGDQNSSRVPIGDDLMNEIDRLSIPSVNGLTVRLSELLPSIKKGEAFLDTLKSDDEAQPAVDSATKSGVARAPMSLDHKRASLISALTAGSVAQSRRGAGSPALNGITGSSKDIGMMKQLPLLPTECRDPRPSLSSDLNAHAEGDGMQEATNPTPEFSVTNLVKNSAALTGEPRPEGTISPQQSMNSSRGDVDGDTGSTNGCGEDTLDIDTDEPQVNKLANGMSKNDEPDGRPSSMMDLPHGDPVRIARSMSPGPHLKHSLVPISRGAVEVPAQKGLKGGLLGSLQRRIGIKSARLAKTSFPVDPGFFHTGERIVSGPGDRYPTTALRPPSHLNIDETRSFFSDGSSSEEDTRNTSLRERLTRLRHRYSTQTGGVRNASRAISVTDHGEVSPYAPWLDNARSLSGNSHIDPAHADVVVLYGQPPSGMSRLEFRAKRLIEKLRIFWLKGGDVIRSLSRARAEVELYEGY